MSVAASIIAKFGGIRPMARALGRPVSTIQYWNDSGFIPAKQQEEVLRRGREMGIDISELDFFASQTGGEAAE